MDGECRLDLVGCSAVRSGSRTPRAPILVGLVKLNLGAGAHPLDGFVNRGPENDGWRFEDGLPEYEDGTVDGITISHSLMYLPLDFWPAVFAEIARVLRPGGVLRVTEDTTDDRRSERYGGAPDAVTLTSADLVILHATAAGLRADRVKPDESWFADLSLVQRWHGEPPKVFHVEALKL